MMEIPFVASVQHPPSFPSLPPWATHLVPAPHPERSNPAFSARHGSRLRWQQAKSVRFRAFNRQPSSRPIIASDPILLLATHPSSIIANDWPQY